MTTTTVWANFTVEGWHRWPEAPDSRSYLGHWHRHLFCVRVERPVHSAKREVEFHDLRDQGLHAVRSAGVAGDFGSQSCEDIATRAIAYLRSHGHDDASWIEVTVSEDGECGATVREP